MWGNTVEKELGSICAAECILNESLPELRTNFCVPLAAMARSSRTTAFVAKSILVMLGSNGSKLIKLINVFDLVLFPRSQDDDEGDEVFVAHFPWFASDGARDGINCEFCGEADASAGNATVRQEARLVSRHAPASAAIARDDVRARQIADDLCRLNAYGERPC